MPDFRAYVRQNLPSLGVDGARAAEVVEELALELEERYERALRNGLAPEQAWLEVTQNRSWQNLGEELRTILGEPPHEPVPAASALGRLAEEFLRDLRHAARYLSKSPGFTLVAVLMLALGIGANTAIFSLLHALLLRNLPVSHPEQLFFFGKVQSEGTTSFMPHGSTEAFSYPFFREFSRRNQVFSNVAAIQSYLLPVHCRVAGGRDIEKINAELVSGSYFRTLGVNAVLGRVLADGDDEAPGAHPIAVASYSWWQDRLAGNPSALGKTVTIGSSVYTIVGVAPPGFSGVTVGKSPNLWIPLAMQHQIDPDENGIADNNFRFLHLFARLKPGVTLKQAAANTDLVFRQILREYVGPEPSPRQLANIEHSWIDLTPAATGRSNWRIEFSEPLKLLMAMVALVLLIACANVANLLLARAAARQREIAVRMSLGAERGRVIRQLFVESGLLGCASILLGVAFAWGAARLLLAMVSPGSEPLVLRVTPDATVLGFAIAVTALTVLFFGGAPAWRMTGIDLAPSLRAGRGLTSAITRNRLSRVLVVGQVALSLVLLTGAGLFLRSLAKLTNVEVGFDKHNVVRLMIDPGAAGHQPDAHLSALMQKIEERVGHLSGIRGASFALSVFDGGGWSENDVTVPGRPGSERNPVVALNAVGPQYLDVMGMPLLLGRGFDDRDSLSSRKVAVINETMARTYLPAGTPLGRIFSVGDQPEGQDIEVIGVVKDAKYMSLEERQMPAAFFPYAQHSGHFVYNLVVRYTGDPAYVVPEIRQGIAEIDPNLPVSDVRKLADMVDDFARNRRAIAQLSSFFGIVAALLACIGIYGVVSYGIARRTNEFGIRMALGADRWNVLWVVLRETLSLAIAGVAIGFALALASRRLIQSLLFQVNPADPLVIAAALAAMLAAAVLAGYLPARRATRVDPAAALRSE